MWKALNHYLKPDLIVDNISDIPIELIQLWKIKGLILDVDNTLLSKIAINPDQKVQEWVKTWKEQVQIVLLSNNIPSKIRRASDPLDLPYIAWTIKPVTDYFRKALRKLDLTPHDVCVVGDQLFTDILGGKLIGAKTIYVRPIDLRYEMLWTRLMRCLERKVIRSWTTNP